MNPPEPLATDSGRGLRGGPPLPPGPLAGFLLALMAVMLIGVFFYRALDNRATSVESITRTFEVLARLESSFSTLKDAETGQRGYLLTGDERYLKPYTDAVAALSGGLQELQRQFADNPPQQGRVTQLAALVDKKMTELEGTVALQRAGHVAQALATVRSDRGQALMEHIRTLIAEIEGAEKTLLDSRQQSWQAAAHTSYVIAAVGCTVLLVLIFAAAAMTSRDYRMRQTQAWLRVGQMGLSARVGGDQPLALLGDKVLGYLAEYLSAQIGAVYVARGDGSFHRIAAYALPSAAALEAKVDSGEGLLGQAAKENRVLHVRDVPSDYFDIASSTGRSRPRELVVAPAAVDGIVHAVLELGFFHALSVPDLELLARISEALGVAVRSAKDRTRLEELLAETRRQAEELQAQQEELRASNEELEEQGRALTESQARLEMQQAELEQVNSQLEEQAQILGQQNDELTRAQSILSEKAAELVRSNQYKSEFLANMSHELRTPLNSALILSRLLADNRDGNLSAEQVKFAQTIYTAGNDLLALINDILDLSRIEAGKVELQLEAVLIARAVHDVVQSFQPIAQQKGLALSATVEPATPDTIDTDPQRLGQILKNLLANALKFTEEGEVALRVFGGNGATVSFAVRDTGIGIPASQQSSIFDAFRQADGSTQRRYEGTGLGLSISRDLARLLGGEITLQSTVGAGSVFTLTLPLASIRGEAVGDESDLRRVPTRSPSPAPNAVASTSASDSAQATPALADDRARVTPGARLILIVEDDTHFAAILRDLAHEMGFLCIVSQTARDALQLALTHVPSAIVLDMNLPDGSGLAVLDELKRMPKTRHIPVHVVSVADYAQKALEQGAIGYELKPVTRERLVETFRRLEAKLSQTLRRVLIIEDDAVQRESIRQLLASGDVEIKCADSASAGLAELHAAPFDCVVMDFNLPDRSGHELLEEMAARQDVSYPPVIVYTGRALTRKEEHALRRHARSIIIKDVRSPERLLDEVTLFLHQVEASLPPAQQRMLQTARSREAALEHRNILVVEDDERSIFALSNVLEPRGARIEIARNGFEALAALERSLAETAAPIDLVLMDIMMPQMDGLTAIREIRQRAEWKKLPIIALTAKAMLDDQQKCLAAGASDYMAKPLDIDKLLSLVRVWMPRN